MVINPPVILTSACLLGIKCRYDGGDSLNQSIVFDGRIFYLPVCPEQLGGLNTPREACEIDGRSGEEVLKGKARVVGIFSGRDFSENFIRGAQETLKTAKFFSCKWAYLKNCSPSCGKTQIICKGEKVSGEGVTAALLRINKIEIKAF
jgi:uncharacterized protein YbbK (DUF523 family)